MYEKYRRHAAGAHRAAKSLWISVFAVVVVLALASGAQAATATAVPLGTAAGFGILAGTGITNSGATTITDGDIGSSPVTTV